MGVNFFQALYGSKGPTEKFIVFGSFPLLLEMDVQKFRREFTIDKVKDFLFFMEGWKDLGLDELPPIFYQ